MFANRKYEELSYPQNQKMCDPILITLLKMQPHYSQSSRKDATPSSGTSPLASYEEVSPGGSYAGKKEESFLFSHGCALNRSNLNAVIQCSRDVLSAVSLLIFSCQLCASFLASVNFHAH